MQLPAWVAGDGAASGPLRVSAAAQLAHWQARTLGLGAAAAPTGRLGLSVVLLGGLNLGFSMVVVALPGGL